MLDVMEGAYSAPGSARSRQKTRAVAEPKGAFGKLSFADPEELKKEIKKLESVMYEQAKNLAFEEAAASRDRIAELKEQLLRQ